MASPLVDVYVKLPSGRTSVLQLLPSERVSAINKHVATEENVPDIRVILKYQGKVLDRNKTVSGYGIRPETILKGEIVIQKCITLYAKLPDGSCVPITTQNITPVSAIIQRLEDEFGVEMKKYKLKTQSGNQIPKSEKPLFDVGLTDESTLTLEEITTPSCDTPKTTQGVISEEASDELKESVISSFAADGRNVEVVFSFDTTGSMSSYLHTVRTNLKETCQRLIRDIPNIRIGIIAHGDYCDYHTYVIRQIDLTSDIDRLVDFAQNSPTTCGGDSPECYEWVLRKSQLLDWSEDSAKALVVIGDCEPHPPSYTDQNINWWSELDVLAGMGVKVYGVCCNRGERQEALAFYEQLAEQTGGCMINLKHFNLITEMFLGVCYSEAAPEQLEAFTEELEKEGKLTEDTKVLMKEIAAKKEQKETNVQKKTDKRFVNVPWWNIQADKKSGSPSYSYDTQNDSWSPYTSPSTHKGSSSSSSSTTPKYVPPKNSKKKKSCVVM